MLLVYLYREVKRTIYFHVWPLLFILSYLIVINLSFELAKDPVWNILQIYDVVRYIIHHMKKSLKDELENKNIGHQYICTNCAQMYFLLFLLFYFKLLYMFLHVNKFFIPKRLRNSCRHNLEKLRLVSREGDCFDCKNCNGEVVAEGDKSAGQ